MNPTAPVAMNAHSHPQVSAIHGTVIGASTAPTLLPALKIPTASARSPFGNHSDTVLIGRRKIPRLAETEESARQRERSRRPCRRVAHRRRAPRDDGEPESSPGADPIQQPAHAQHADAICELNQETMSP